MLYFSTLLKLTTLPFLFAVSLAMSLGSFLFFLTYFPAVAMHQSFERMPSKQKLIWSFDFNVGMAFGFRFLVNTDAKSE
jgi:ATP-binding cassette subfamily A (ABC1) protein 3